MSPAASATAPTIAACLIVQDEEARLPGALESVAFCDEIVVVDGGSRDRTVAIARAAGARVIENAWPGYAAQRNVALDATTADWVLEIDADERVSPSLAESIQALTATAADEVDAGACPLRNRFLGRMLGPSAKYPQYRLRLFRHNGYRHNEAVPVHEGVSARGRTAVLSGDIEHELAGSWNEAFEDAWHYVRLQARHITPPRSASTYVTGAVTRPAAKLVYRLLLEGGWKDGWRGFAKIGLDCLSDSGVWLVVLLRRLRGEQAGGLASAAGHFGRMWWAAVGPINLVALAAGAESTHRACAWLADARRAGAEVAVVTAHPEAAHSAIRVRAVPRMAPLLTLRALEAESQLLSLDCTIAFDARARLMRRLVPRHLRGAVRGIVPAMAGAEAEALVRAHVRPTA